MTEKKNKSRFIFLGGIPVFDYMIEPTLDEIRAAVNNDIIMIDNKMLLPLGTVFSCRVEGQDEPVLVNPMAACEVQQVNDKSYYTLVLGGKHGERKGAALRPLDQAELLRELGQAFPGIIRDEADLRKVEVQARARVQLGGNNRNLIDAIYNIYSSVELKAESAGIEFEHLFFFDVKNPKFKLVKKFYQDNLVAIGDIPEMHIDNLVPRISYVLTISGEEGRVYDRIVMSNQTNEEIIPIERLAQRYFDLEYKLRKDAEFVSTNLIINSLTNPEELRLVCRLLHTAYASAVTTFLCPTKTLFQCMDGLVNARYYTSRKERFFLNREEFIYDAILPFIQYLILNTDELQLLDKVVRRRGIDLICSQLVRLMNQGKKGENDKGGRLLLTEGSKGVRYTERLTPARALVYWKKARMPEDAIFKMRYADRRIICGDDFVDELISTLGAGDTFTGIFIALKALGWDSGHALRAATLGAQSFIRTRKRPQIKDLIAADERHIMMGTETELRDIISHHLQESGDPTRYGTITDTIITINTTQVQHPFREVLKLAQGIVKARKKPLKPL
ncbi:MAG: carbohydrate kinase family protein [Deltaproteobacteria bacterium]|nr:carbohydrate kinase family protein [Deltaproteobacteria bacterium]